MHVAVVHVPPLHAIPGPHDVPSGWLPSSVHTAVPVVQLVCAVWHGLVEAQVWLAVQVQPP
jgi:hypothetical protein